MKLFKSFALKYKTQTVWASVTLVAGGIGALLSGGFDIYDTFIKPPFSPPAMLFPVVWSLLYIITGAAAGNIAASCDLDKGEPLKLYICQLAVNILWPLFFFKLKALKFACFWLVLLIVLIIAVTVGFRRIDRRSTYAMLPYLLWSCFALYLNLGFVVLNYI